jgi:hypothetical protein
MKYQKKPVVIEAVRFKGNEKGNVAFSSWPSWIKKAFYKKTLSPSVKDNMLCIETLEGAMRASKGDYIIKGVHGELYSCKPDIFEETYEPIQPDEISSGTIDADKVTFRDIAFTK